MKKILALILALTLLLSLTGCTEILDKLPTGTTGTVVTQKPTDSTTVPDATGDTDPTDPTQATTTPLIDENGWYYSKEDVSLYLHTYGRLPGNFLTKSQARALGWKSGSVERFKEGAAIGGDTFQNREGLLPKAEGRQYYECDIDTNGQSSRGAKRIVFSNDGLIYYTNDHYASFTLLYGGE